MRAGSVVPNPDAVERRGSALCLDVDGHATACCAWKAEPYVLPLQIVAGVVLMWTAAIATQLRTYIMGGVITQWYALCAFTSAVCQCRPPPFECCCAVVRV